jgi:peptidoglycan hydrolase-like protein with peptidoglycan-binding domain
MKKLSVSIKKALASLMLGVAILTTAVVGQAALTKPIVAKAHYAVPHSYPGYLIKYAPSYYDDHVKVVQWYLATHPADEHQYSVSIDGYFGTQTKNAVMQFQADHGLTVDGIVGSQTWNALVYEFN